MKQIQRLPKTIKLKGIGVPGLTMTELKSDGLVRLYERADKLYEVGIVKIAKAAKLFGKDYPDREVIWNSEDFGINAKAKNTLKGALEAFDMFVKIQKNKDNE